MKSRFFQSTGLLILAFVFTIFVAQQAEAVTLVDQGHICWQNRSSYDQVIVHFEPNGNSDWDTNMTVNGTTIASTGNNSNYSGQSNYLAGNSVYLGWQQVGCGKWICASYNPSIDYNQCDPVFEDTGIQPNEGHFWLEGYKYVYPSLSVSKSASPTTLAVGASNQKYTVTISGISALNASLTPVDANPPY